MTSRIQRRVWKQIPLATARPALVAGLCLLVAGCSGGGGGGTGECNPFAGPCPTSGTDAGTGGAGVTGSGDAEPGDPCNGTVDCTPGSICWNEICVGEGSLRFSLAWTAISDFDLHVQTPSGAELYYGNRNVDGGSLDVDDCISNSCTNPTGTHVENIYWVGAASRGTYLVWVENYNGGASGSFTIEVAGANGGPFTGTLPASSGASSDQFSVTY